MEPGDELREELFINRSLPIPEHSDFFLVAIDQDDSMSDFGETSPCYKTNVP